MEKKLAVYNPFQGILPEATQAGEIIAPPYDVLSSEEAKEKAIGHPKSFLHISKAEIDLPDGTDPYSQAVYDKAAENFRHMLMQGQIFQYPKEAYYIYQLQMGEYIQTGLVVSASVRAYNENRIKKHELTRIAKEDDRVRQIEAVGAQTGPVLLVNKDIPEVREMLKKEVEEREPFFAVEGEYGVIHRLWILDDAEKVALITQKFDEQKSAYIADGHHRSAAASRVAAAKGGDGTNPWDGFLAVVFFAQEMKILEYNRLVKDLNGLTEEAFLKAVAENFEVKEEKSAFKPACKGMFGLYLKGKWYSLRYTGAPVGETVADLDVSVLSDKVLTPVLGIKDLRKSDRIDFSGGIRGVKALEQRVDSGEMAAAFCLFPTSIQELMSVADEGKIMPPKSTWFEPKLADGVVSKMI